MEIIEINCEDKEYPSRLLQIKNYPKTIYAVGDVSLLNKEKILGIVGSRECSEYGRKVATEFSKELSKNDIAIISGLAIGIDSAAHIGAVENIR
jgi:DNA processing protein